MRLNTLTRGLLSASVLAFATGAYAQDVQPYEGWEQLPEITLSYSEFTSPQSDAGKATLALVDYVTKASGGKIKIDMFWSSSLMSLTETPEGIASGLADMGGALPVYTPADFPVTNWLTTLSGQAKGGNPYGQMVISGANSEFHITNADIKKEYEDRGLHILGAVGGNAYDFLCTSPVKSLADAKGKRTRTPNQTFAFEAEALGMVPVPLVIGEVYEAFSRGIIDCIILQPHSYVNFGVTDVERPKYFINIDLSGWIASLTLVNKSKWDTLPPLAQKILTDGYTQYMAVNTQITYDVHQKFGNLIKEGKITPVDADQDLLDALHAQQAKALAEMASKAPAGVENPQAFIDEYLALVAKWKGIVDGLGFKPAPAKWADIEPTWYETRDFSAYQARVAEELAKDGTQ